MSLNESLKGKFSILIIDDEEDIRNIFEETLIRKGYTKVKSLGTGEEALMLLASNFYDIAMIDLHLPDINGMDLISKLRAISPDTEFIIITGYGSLDSAIKALQFDVGGYLEKPISTDKLLRTLDEVIIKHNLKMENNQFLRDLEKANKEILYLNDLLVNNIDELNQSLLLTMVQIEKLHPTNEQRKVLNLFQQAIRKNARLTRNIKKLQSIENKSEEQFSEIDISRIFSNVLNRLQSDYSDKNFDFLGDLTKPYFVYADTDINHLLSEILLNSILNDPSPKIKIAIDFSEEERDDKNYLKLNIKAFQSKQIYDQKHVKNPTELMLLVDDHTFQDLGPFVINSLIRAYNGFVELPDVEDRNLIALYLPSNIQ